VYTNASLSVLKPRRIARIVSQVASSAQYSATPFSLQRDAAGRDREGTAEGGDRGVKIASINHLSCYSINRLRPRDGIRARAGPARVKGPGMGIKQPSCFPFPFYRYPAINLHRRVDMPAGLGRLKKFAAFNERRLVFARLCSSLLSACFLIADRRRDRRLPMSAKRPGHAPFTHPQRGCSTREKDSLDRRSMESRCASDTEDCFPFSFFSRLQILPGGI